MPLASGLLESGTFWTIVVGAVATLLGGAVGAWIAHRLANPKRELHYAWLQNVSLLDTPTSSSTAPLSVSHGATTLTKPRIIDVSLHNAGKEPITATSFHAGNPIELDLDATIFDVLSVTSEPATSITPAWSTAGSILSIPPCLLVGSQTVIFSILVDGDANNLALRSPLSDVNPVETRNRPSADALEERRRRMVEQQARVGQFMSVIACVAIMASTLMAALALKQFSDRQIRKERGVEKVCESNPSAEIASALECPK